MKMVDSSEVDKIIQDYGYGIAERQRIRNKESKVKDDIKAKEAIKTPGNE